jgi:hypothetical protein
MAGWVFWFVILELKSRLRNLLAFNRPKASEYIP